MDKDNCIKISSTVLNCCALGLSIVGLYWQNWHQITFGGRGASIVTQTFIRIGLDYKCERDAMGNDECDPHGHHPVSAFGGSNFYGYSTKSFTITKFLMWIALLSSFLDIISYKILKGDI